MSEEVKAAPLDVAPLGRVNGLRVAILGGGSRGIAVAKALIESGVSTIFFADHDKVSQKEFADEFVGNPVFRSVIAGDLHKQPVELFIDFNNNKEREPDAGYKRKFDGQSLFEPAKKVEAAVPITPGAGINKPVPPAGTVVKPIAPVVPAAVPKAAVVPAVPVK